MQNSSEMQSKTRINEILELLRSPDSEGGRFHNAQLLRQADSWLSGYIESGFGSGRNVLLHIRVMSALKDWERVTERVRREVWKEKKVRARALVEAAVAYISMQEFTSAGRCLGMALGLDPSLEARVGRVQRRLEVQLRLELYGRLSSFVYQAVKTGQGEVAENLYVSALHVQGYPSEVTCSFSRTLCELVSLTNESRECEPLREDSSSAPSRLVITCGSGYSGTGAVMAYLRELDGLPMPFGARELSILKKPYGLYGLLSKWSEWNYEERRQALQKMMLKSVLGVPCYETPSSVDRTYTRSITWTSMYYMDEALNEAQASALSLHSRIFMRDAVQASTREDLERVCSEFLNRMLRIRCQSVGLFNNCIHQAQLSLAGLLDNAKVIVVVRDPRDQYVAHQTETRGKKTTVEAFIKKRQRAVKAINSYLKSGKDNVKVFRFEEFVADPGVRSEVLSWAGLAGFRMGGEPRFFFPEQSAKNVGIYRKWKDESEIGLIERELKDQLVDL